MSDESDRMNYQTTKELYDSSKKSVRQMVRAVIRASPRDILIEILKDMKVIKAEYHAGSDELVLIERIKKSRKGPGGKNEL